MNRNIKIARELVRIAKELAASSYDNAQLFQKAVSKPTSQNVGKFVKSITPKTGGDGLEPGLEDELDSVEI